MKTIYFDKNRNVVPKKDAVYFERIDGELRIYGDLRTDADRQREDIEKERELLHREV